MRVSTLPARAVGAIIDIDSELVLETFDGKPVPVMWTSGGDAVHRYIIGRPRQVLAANTSYRVRHVIECNPSDAGAAAIPMGQAGWCSGSACSQAFERTLTTFTTGATLDTTPPAPPVIGKVMLSPTTEAAPLNTCSGWSGCSYRAEASVEVDARLRIRTSTGTVVTEETAPAITGFQLLTHPSHHTLSMGADGQNYGYDPPLSADSYQVTAVDAAGNESAPVTMLVERCPAITTGTPPNFGAEDAGNPDTKQSDAGLAGAGDGASGSTQGIARPNPGCSMAAPSTERTEIRWLILGLAGLLAVRRDQRPRGRG